MAQYQYGDTLTISTDNIAFNGTMPDESDVDFGESYYQNTYTEMVSPTNPKDKYVTGSARIIWASGFPTPSSPEYDITEGRRAMWLTTVTGYPNKYYPVNPDLVVDWQEGGTWKYGGRPQVTFTMAWTHGTEPNSTSVGSGSTSYPITEVFLETNIPVFETKAEALAYVLGESDGTNAINYESATTSPDGHEFRLEVQWTTSTWINDNQPQVTGQPYMQGVKGKITNVTEDAFGTHVPFALYKIDGISDGKLKYGIKNNAEFYDLEYTTDGVTWTPTDTFPFNFIYRKRENELGTFSYALSEWNTDIPLWEDEETADDYMRGDKSINDASNWNSISSQYPPTNPTGVADDITTMGGVYTRSFFSQQYICSASALQEISNAFFDTDSGGITGIVDDIIKGLRMYGNDISQAIQGLMFFPIDLTQVLTSISSQQYIYFGGYQFNMQNSVSKIIYPNGYVDFGSFDLKPTFNNYRDHNPYTRLYVYLAYCGWMELDIDRYLGKTVSIRYYIDTRTGGILACLFANGVLTDYQNGQMGVQMPITTTSYTDYANAQIQTLLTFGNGQMSNAQNIAQMGGQLASEGVATGVIGVGATALGGIGASVGATKTLYGLTQNNINNFNKTKGASTSMLNLFLPQECMFLFEIQESDETSNERGLQGYPTNASGQIQSFSGYLEVDAVDLVCGGATDNEKAQIVAQLKSGVII